jgi:hypothetical protein
MVMASSKMTFDGGFKSAVFVNTCFAAILLFLFSCVGEGQTFTGSIFGHAFDSQQVPIPHLTVTLLSADRGFELQATTNQEGEYLFQLVNPGSYTLHVEASGFIPTTVNVEVAVATSLRADLSLSVKPLHEEVKVLGGGRISVQSENANLGRTISPREISELPSLTRSPYDFIAIVPGASLSNDQIGVGFNVNGGRTQSASYLLDGGENNETSMSAPAIDVPLDSIQEFSVQTNHFSAEYGRNSGFIANLVTKSGTNAFHGSLYDYIRNSAFAANTFDNNARSLPDPVFNRHQFGGSIGGPIRQSRLFFFAAIEPILVRSTGPNSFYVPTPELIAISSPGTQSIFGDYPLPSNLSSTDVLSVNVCPYAATCDPQSGSGFVRLNGFALTTRSGGQDAGAGSPQNTILATGRLDWSISQSTQGFMRYAIEEKNLFATVTQPYSKALDAPITGGGQNVAFNLVHTWSPSVVTESRLGYSRVFGDPDRIAGESPTVPQPPFPVFAILSLPNVVLPSGNSSYGGPENLYQFVQTATWSHGHHTIRFGGMYAYRRENLAFGFADQNAEADFSNAQGFVDGTIHRYSIGLDPQGHFPGQPVDPPFGPPSFTRHYRYNEPSLFIEDTWKIRPRLTLTPGLRWEYFGVLHSPGAEHSFDSNFYNGTGTNQLEQIANGSILQTVNAPGNLHGRFYLPNYKSFAPRLGAAYDLFGDGKTVIRSGVGVFYDRRVGWELTRVFANPPAYSIATLTDIALTSDVLTNQYSVFPDSPVNLNQSAAKSIATNLRPAYTVSWNATVEHEFSGEYVFAASYLGSSGSQLYSTNPINRIGSDGLLDPSCIETRYAADTTTPIGPDYTNCPTLNPLLASLSIRANDGHSSFEALQLSLEGRRLSHLGLEFGANYTWSHSIDNRSVSGLSGSFADTGSGSLDAFNPSLDRGSSDFDVRHRIGAHWIWAIPLARDGKNWRDRFLFSGWEVSGLLNYQTGQPFTIGDSGVPDLTSERTRPRLSGLAPRPGPLVPDPGSANSFLFLPVNQAYDPENGGCLANATPFTCEISVNGPFDDTLPRNTFRQPALFFMNVGLLKNFSLPREGISLQFRAEFYNLLNHSNLYLNSGTADINTQTFTNSSGESVPGVTASYRDNRQIVLALRFLF